ncbi:MAG TPA: GNAT family N-acetyltransferase [Trueperaceae bacterium]|nr:GNAT family N-acetyltransferase [Trueperaceae bacterium]
MLAIPSVHPYATVRIASPADLTAVREVADTTWHATYREILSKATIDAFLRRFYSDYRILAAVNDGGLWVLEEDGRVVGYERLSMRGDVGYIGAIYVLPESQRLGHGRRLIDTARPWFAARGASEIRLTVAEHNHAARAFYRHLGFEEHEAVDTQLMGEPLAERVCVLRLLQPYLFRSQP